MFFSMSRNMSDKLVNQVYVILKPCLLATGAESISLQFKATLTAIFYVWHKALLFKLHSYGFYPSFCSFVSSVLSDRSFSAVVDCYCSSLKSIKVVFHRAVLYPTLFLLFINDLSSMNCPIHSYTEDPTLNYSTFFFNSELSQLKLKGSGINVAECLSSDLTIIFDWDKRNLVSINSTKKLNFFIYQLDTIFQITITYSSITLNYPLLP